LLLAGVAGPATWYFAPPPKHQVQTLFNLPARSPFLPRVIDAGPELLTHQRNQVALCKSRLVLQSALRAENVGNLSLVVDKIDPVAWLEKEVQVDFSVAPEIMRISMGGMETDELVILVNAIREAYLREAVDKERTYRRERLAWLGEMIQKYDDQLRVADETQKGLVEKAGSKYPDVRGLILSFTQQQLGTMEAELLKAQAELRKATLELAGLKAREEKAPQFKVPEANVVAALAKADEIITLRAEIVALEKRITRTLGVAFQGEKEPAVIRDRAEITRLNGEINRISERLRPKIIERLRETARLDLQAGISIEEARISNRNETIALLESDVKRLRERVAEQGKQGVKLDAFTEDVSHLKSMWNRLKGEQEALKVALQAPNPVEVREPATVKRVDVQMRKMMMAGGAALAALCAALLGVALLEHGARRVDQVDEVVFGLGMRLVGTVPRVAKRARAPSGKPGPSNDPAQQVLVESVDAVRTMLLHLARTQSLRTVMVTSAGAREGKTSLSCRLAVSLARSGLRALLIDGDTRNPSIHKVFGVPCESGFCEVLCAGADISSVIRTSPVPGLSLLPAGRRCEQMSQALGQGRARALFEMLGQEFDIILVDVPPILPVADALMIGQQVDGILLSALCRVTRLNNLYAASQRIEELNIRTLGVVISGVDGRPYGALQYPYSRKRAAKV
jgi:capsular exopolysaccharide synthesis family protein